RFHIDRACGAKLTADCHRPWRVHSTTKRSENTNAPVAQFITYTLDHNGSIIRNRGRGYLLIGEITNEVFCRGGIEIVFADETADRRIPWHLAQFANQLPDTPAKFQWTACSVSMPEGHLARLARSR